MDTARRSGQTGYRYSGRRPELDGSGNESRLERVDPAAVVLPRRFDYEGHTHIETAPERS